MNLAVFNLSVLRSPSWWHWATTVPLLAATIAGWAAAAYAAIAWCGLMSIYYLLRVQTIWPFAVQVRLVYLLLLLAGLLPGQAWIYWMQLIGTTALVAVGYCPLARMLQLAPWNRKEPLTLPLVWRTVVAPRAGGIFAGYRPSPHATSAIAATCGAAGSVTNTFDRPAPACGVCELPPGWASKGAAG